MENRPANSRRGTAGASGQARHAYNGRCADRWLSPGFNLVMGTTKQCLRLDHHGRHAVVWSDRFYGRLREDGETKEFGTNGQAKVDWPISYRSRRLGTVIYFDQVFCDQVFVEFQHSFLEIHS